MDFVRLVWKDLLNLLFPLPSHLERVDRITLSELERAFVTRRVEVPYVCVAALRYQHTTVRACVHAAKYHAHERAARLLGAALAPVLAEELAERHAFETYREPLVLPVPLHAIKLQLRGFNQAERVARATCSALGLSAALRTDLLVRIRATSSQAHTRTRASRFENMRNAFRVPHPECVAGRDVVLVDDVVTTGATFAAAREALFAAGAREVLCVAAAH